MYEAPWTGNSEETRETSREAAEAIKPVAATLRMEVYRIIQAAGMRGLTDDEIQVALGMAGNTERPRRRELEEADKIEPTGVKYPTRSGRHAIAWRAK